MQLPHNKKPKVTPHHVTFKTLYSIDVFTDPLYKKIVVDSLKYCQEHKGLVIHAWCILTDRVELIIHNAGIPTLSDIVRDCKAFTSRHIRLLIEAREDEPRKHWMLWMMYKEGEFNSNNKDFQFWEQDNKPVAVCHSMLSNRIADLHSLPVDSGFVREPQQWIYSSAIDYTGGKGLIDISIIQSP